MSMHLRHSLVFLAAMVSFSALAETINCTAITQAMVPYTVSSPGVYCLTGDLVTSDPTDGYYTITINANNVVLDFNGHRIGGLGAGTATAARGIYALDRQNVTIKNGTIRGYFQGITLDDTNRPPTTSQGHVIEDMRLDQNTVAGIGMAANSSVIRRNQVIATGGTTYMGFPDANVQGISLTGNNNRVIDNDVSNIYAKGFGAAHAINLDHADSAVVSDNRVSLVTTPGIGAAIGIALYVSNGPLISGNRVTGLASATGYSIGIFADSPYGVMRDNLMTAGSANGTYGGQVNTTLVLSGNIAAGFATPYTGGIDAGGNH